MSTEFSTSSLRLPLLRPGANKVPLAGIVDILDILPLKVRLADDGSCIDGCDSFSDADDSDIDEDLAAEPRLAGPISLPPGLTPPPGLGLEVANGLGCLGGAAGPAEGAPLRSQRTPLRGRATVYSPLSSHAEAFVPKNLALLGGKRPGPSCGDCEAPQWTTVMMRNMPLSYTCDSLIDLLDSEGFSGWFDFVYVPIKRAGELGVGYGFVNLTSAERAEEFILAFEGFDGWASSSSEAACSMSWSVCQGLSENIRRYRDSPFMRDDIPAMYKPVLLKDGVRVPFPEPTRPLRTLRHRNFKGVDFKGVK